MCGIFALFARHFASKYNRAQLLQNFERIRGRGPDLTKTVTVSPDLFYGFHRLAIMDLTEAGMQPMNLDDKLHLICNGEIYNHEQLTKQFNFPVKSGSDCEVILHLYREFNGDITRVAQSLDGVFAFVLYDAEKDIVFAGRDPIGVRPLFIGYDEENDGIFFASESKAFINYTKKVQQFPPGSVWNSTDEIFKTWWSINNINNTNLTISSEAETKDEDLDSELQYDDGINFRTPTSCITTEPRALKVVNKTLTNAVSKRLMAERPIATFLSGGLDSSLVTALVNRLNPYPINTYAIGMEGATDLYYAEKVARFVDTNHTSVTFTPEEGIAAVEEVISTLETYDITTIRASVGMHLLSKYISKNTDDIVIYSGEGADEITQGYLYFHNAPCSVSSASDSQRLVDNLHYFDVKRVDRCVSTHGLEVRVPFLDKTFMRNFFRIDPTLRAPSYRGIEKYLVRKAFDHEELLPSEVLWRTKEAFSDGVSSVKKPWHEILKTFVDTVITDEEYYQACIRYENMAVANEGPGAHGQGSKVPIHKEAYYYRTLYEKHFGSADLIPYYWMPMWSDAKDPSARTIGKYKELID